MQNGFKKFSRAGAAAFAFVSLAIAAPSRAHAEDCDIVIEPGDFRTQTQGGWGADANGDNPGTYRDAHFAACFPDGLKVGSDAGFTLTLTSAAAVNAFLPATETPGPLTQDHVDPLTTEAGVLAGQVVTLTLSVGFDMCDPAFGASDALLKDLVISDPNSALFGKTVGEALQIANGILSGASTEFTAADINAVITAINENFDNGTFVGDYLKVPCPPKPCEKEILPGDFRTQTQGGWGAVPNGANPATYRDAHFLACFPTGVTVGSLYTIKLTTSKAVENYLPAGGTAMALKKSYLNPLTTGAGVLGGQVVALALNIGFDACDPNFGASPFHLTDLVINDPLSPFFGKTVAQVFAIANAVLGGSSTAFTPLQVNEAVTKINENFVDGTMVGTFLILPCPKPCEDDVNPGDFRTQTQGGWGSTANGNNPGAYRDAHFAACFPLGVVIGDPSGFTVALTSSLAVELFLPQGGAPAALTSSHTDPPSTEAGVLAGQVAALTLSVGFDLCDPDFGASAVHLKDLVVSDPDSIFNGMTVADILAKANAILGGTSTEYTPSEINEVLTSINGNFVNGTVDGGFLCLP